VTSSPDLPARRALLVGAPLGDLGGVDESIAALSGLLEARGFTIERLVGPTARRAEVLAAQERLLAAVRPGDAVVFYWAGHGLHIWDPAKPKELFPVLVTMDALESTKGDARAILGIELAHWLTDVMQAAALEGKTNVTAILECCHSGGLVDDQGLDAEGLARARRVVAAELEKKAKQRRRGSIVVALQLVRVAAADTFSRAYGDANRTVGGVTLALVELLDAHPHESWQALEHRLRARILPKQPQQQPGVEGRRERIPFTTIERSLPEGVHPCIRDDDGRWRCELAKLQAAQDKALYRITDDLDASGGLFARMDAHRGWLSTLDSDDAAPGTMRWALPVDPARGLRVELREADGVAPSASLREGLARAGVEAPATDEAMIVLEPRTDGSLVLHDTWGDAVVRWTSEPPLDRLLAWVVRLSELHRWLRAAQTPSPQLQGAFELVWGVQGPDGASIQLDARAPVVLPNGAAAWIELRNLGVEPRLYLSVFRIKADRSVEHLTRDGAGGLPGTSDRPARLGLGARTLVLSRPEGQVEPASEALVAIVTIRPLPLHGLERAAIDRESTPPTVPARAMVVLRYRLEERA